MEKTAAAAAKKVIMMRVVCFKVVAITEGK